MPTSVAYRHHGGGTPPAAASHPHEPGFPQTFDGPSSPGARRLTTSPIAACGPSNPTPSAPWSTRPSTATAPAARRSAVPPMRYVYRAS